MRLDLGLNLAATMLARDGRCRVIGRGIEFIGAAIARKHGSGEVEAKIQAHVIMAWT